MFYTRRKIKSPVNGIFVRVLFNIRFKKRARELFVPIIVTSKVRMPESDFRGILFQGLSFIPLYFFSNYSLVQVKLDTQIIEFTMDFLRIQVATCIHKVRCKGLIAAQVNG